MKKKLFTRSVGVMFTEEMYLKIKEITDREDIGVSDFIRQAVQLKLEKEANSRSSSLNIKKGETT
jgi:metal-responsive CopG/Arc/MetJ family transcriptional regulator